jgi:hypothetical protein
MQPHPLVAWHELTGILAYSAYAQLFLRIECAALSGAPANRVIDFRAADDEPLPGSAEDTDYRDDGLAQGANDRPRPGLPAPPAAAAAPAVWL